MSLKIEEKNYTTVRLINISLYIYTYVILVLKHKGNDQWWTRLRYVVYLITMSINLPDIFGKIYRKMDLNFRVKLI